jgi:hypothetical protein
MFDDYTRDILTIIGLILGVGFGFYALDKNKQTKVLKIVYLLIILIPILYNVYNIYNFFNLELTHKNIFTFVISVISLSLLISIYLFYIILNISAKHAEISKEMATNSKELLQFIKFNNKSILILRELLHEIDEKEFQKKYKDTIEKIDGEFKNLVDKN